MSKISDALIELKVRIDAALPSGYIELANPFEIEENPETSLKQGYGIRAGGGENSNRQLSCQLSIDREIVIILTSRFFAKQDDRVARASEERDLFEDQFLLVKDFESTPILETGIANFNYKTDGGIERVFTEKDNFLKLETTFSMEYFENLI